MPEYHEGPLGFGPELFSFPYGEHVFVWARPLKRDWSYFDGTNLRQDKDEWRPVTAEGHGTGQKIRSPGSAYGFAMSDFEFGPELVWVATVEADAAPVPKP